MNEVIRVVQLPVIAYDALKAIGAEVTERINALNLEGQVATEDTIKALKKLREVYNKELEYYEDQRKAVKSAVNEPYSKFEAKYKAEIYEKYDSAIKTLKDKINKYEIEIKRQKEAELKTYFEELTKVEGLDWLTWEKINLQVNLSTSLAAFKKQISEVIAKVVDDLKLINTEKDFAEMLTEYKKSLNASQAITTVRERKEAVRLEEERKRYDMIEKRKAYLRNLPMVSHDLTKTINYVYNEDIFILWSDVEADTDTWRAKLVELEAKIAAYKASHVKDEPAAPAPAPIIQAPVVVEADPLDQIGEATFKVTASIRVLRQLGDYLKANNITYENI